MAEEYYTRISDKILDIKLETFDATHIVGPKWCGKTTTVNQKAKSSLKLQNLPNKAAIIKAAEITPSVLLESEKPRLIDEWQNASEIWDAVRSYCDEHSQKGNFILTGSTSKIYKPGSFLPSINFIITPDIFGIYCLFVKQSSIMS